MKPLWGTMWLEGGRDRSKVAKTTKAFWACRRTLGAGWVLCGGLLLRRTERRSYRETSDVSHAWLRQTLSALTPQGGTRKAELGVVFELLPVNGAQRVMASTSNRCCGPVGPWFASITKLWVLGSQNTNIYNWSRPK